ncbi:glutathione synthase [Sphingomicrobium sediminis]|uniref:Glutathione synthetase n=1 Tax=Sphingomicrobium sediminis TaxID=2950949 RepID=A0A9X2J3D2_9SPHN|nr:glutathione synthase [Sphingomicrobium sediminis]MCM8557186.1 glutathione synthase [Sphingomicrobium sediminis]
MSRAAAFQMDPIEGINIAGDSTFALMLEAQDRGYTLYEYQPGALSYLDGRVRANARPVTVRREKGNHFEAGEYRLIDLGEETDVIWVRQDPPFDIGYITAAHLLERVAGESLVLNDPASIRDAPEKLFVLDFADYMPATLITRSESEVRDFLAEHGDIIVKPLHGKGGEGVFRIGKDGQNLSSLVQLYRQELKEPFIAQAFLPAISEGDKRIILVDGEPIGGINRVPAKGEFRSNMVVGGSATKTELTEREREICAAIGPELKNRGLLFVGIDVIGGLMTEINVTSPTGLVALDTFDGINSAGLIWDAVEVRLRD